MAAQALHPIESAPELKGDRQSVAKLIASDDTLRSGYEQAFGRLPALYQSSPSYVADVDHVFANVGRALAAFERRIVSTDSPFDRYAEALGQNEAPPADFSVAAQRGLKLFIGRANCVRCHSGPSFSDGEFHNTGLAGTNDEAMLEPFSRDASARLSPEILALSRHAPDELARLAHDRRSRGEFKTPTLRNVAERAPYMHDGRFATLRDVLAYYSTLNGSSFDAFRVTPPIRPLHLSQRESDDLIAFLKTLTGTLANPGWGLPPPSVARSASNSIH